ncbi:MAG: hypothetical protein JWQ66_1547 [Mucilaginibacter sp.]|nr:hypothetical protein [Mucilaginibacter sp.]
MCRPIIPFNAFVSAVISVLVLIGCNQTPKQTSTKNPAKIVSVKSIVKPSAIKIDSPLICVGYSDAEIGKFDIEQGSYEDFVLGNENYFKGKTKLSDNYVKKHLFNGLDSVPLENPYSNGEIVGKTDVNEYIQNNSFFSIKPVLKTARYRGIIYEELPKTDLNNSGSRKYFSTINDNGKFISRLIIASYEFAGTYTKDDGTKGGYYSGVAGCISKNLIIDMGGGDEGKYKVHSDGKIVKYMGEYYDSLLVISPKNAEIRLKYARYLRDKVDNDFVNAKKQFELALNAKPNDEGLNGEYAELLWERFNDTVNAQRYFKKAIGLNPKYSSFKSEYRAFLNRHLTERQYRAAFIKGYEKAFTGIDSTDFEKQFDYAHFLHTINRNAEGRKHYLKAVELNSNLKNKKDDDIFGIK